MTLNPQHRIKSVLKNFNRLNPTVLIFLCAIASYAGFILYGGEEQYFAFAKQYMNPNWIENSFTLTHPAGGNLFFQLIVGFLLRLISFENMAFYGRMVNFILLAIPLAKIFRYFKLNNIEILCLLIVFWFPRQSFFAGEWIFQNLEVKTIAYIFVLYAYYFLFKDKYWHAILFMVPATWFHFLVGGWNFVVLVIYFVFKYKRIKEIIRPALAYSLLVLPFVIYLYRTYMLNTTVIEGVNTNWIYAYERLSHHLALFKSWQQFKHLHIDGIITSFIFFFLCVFYFKRFNIRIIQQLNKLNIILFSIQIVFLLVALVDRNGTLLKLYPFRINTMFTLFIMVELALLFKLVTIPWLAKIFSSSSLNWKTRKKISVLSALLFFGIGLIVFISECQQAFQNKNNDVPELTTAMKELIAYAKTNTDSKSVFLFIEDDHPLSFHRKAERERFVVWKFTPTKSETIYEWYQRYKWKEKLQENIDLLHEFVKENKLDYFVSDGDCEHNLLKLEKSFGDLKLYRIITDNQWTY